MGIPKAKTLFRDWKRVFDVGSLALTYFRERLTHYHWRGLVSRSCSGREGVVPRRYGHQTVKGVTEVFRSWSRNRKK